MPVKRPARSPSIIDVAVGRNVRIRRLAKGLSQAQLAMRLGLTFQQVQKYEAGASRIASGRLVRIAQLLEVPVTALLEVVEGIATSPAPLLLLADRQPLRLAQAFAAIKDGALRLSIAVLVEQVASAVPRSRRRGT
jgi:transcriptional regulator with XRE-family HTH domain